MRLLYIADGRSPTALNWIGHFADSGHEVHLISTYPCEPELALASLVVIPIAFTGLMRGSIGRLMRGRMGGGRREPGGEESEERWAESAKPERWSSSGPRLLGSRTIGLRTSLRHWLGPLTVAGAARRARKEIARIRPQLVHAMRVPFEGMLAAAAEPSAPLLLSVWGNDFTLHAPASWGMRALTRKALRRADALHTDCERDRRLAERWGFRAGLPSAVLPGNGGVKPDIFRTTPAVPSPESALASVLSSIPEDAPVVINPRGFRGYVRNDTFFKAVPRVLSAQPGVIFLCPAMGAERRAQRWLSRLGIGGAVRLLPTLSANDMAAAYQRAQVMISPSEHDGTPNTLLEAMACGAFPVVGDLESIREWIEPGLNGLLIDPADPAELAQAIVQALQDPDLRARAGQHNAQLIAKRASYPDGMAKADSLYRSIVG